MFGVTLEELVERDSRKGIRPDREEGVPEFFCRMVEFLKKTGLSEEGIFRKAGSAVRIKELRQRCQESDVDFVRDKCHPHDVATLLKQFIRDIPEPLLSTELIETFASTAGLDDHEAHVLAVQLLVHLLPRTHRRTLKYLFGFLSEVEKQQESNKMTAGNLAVVFAPGLFYTGGAKGKTMLKEVDTQLSTATTLKVMLEHSDLVSYAFLKKECVLIIASTNALIVDYSDVEMVMRDKAEN